MITLITAFNKHCVDVLHTLVQALRRRLAISDCVFHDVKP